MTISKRLLATTSTLATSLFLAVGVAYAAPAEDQITVHDGAEAVGTIVASGDTVAVGSSDGTTIYTNFVTEGGAGSGGGAGLGGVFFVDQGATLNLNNVSFRSNVAKGGEGGGISTVSLSNISLGLPTVSVNADPITVVNFTPTLQVTGGQVYITGATLPGSNVTLGTGAGVTFDGLSATGSIAGVSGSSVTLAAPVLVDPSAIRNVSINTGHYTQTVQVPIYDINNQIIGYTPTPTLVLPQAGSTTIQVGSSFSGSDLRPGMAIIGTGIAAGTKIASVNYDNSNNVTSITLSQATTAAVSGFDVVGVSSFEADRYQVTGSNTVKTHGAMPGLLAGMTVTGNGIPAGTTITHVADDGSITFSNAVAPVGGFTATTEGASVGSNVINLLSARNDLAVGMTVTGDGIPAGTTITGITGGRITLSNALTSAAADAIANNNFIASFGTVISSTGSSLTLASVEGLQVGALLTGGGVPADAVITGIDNATKTVTYIVDETASSKLTGGSMNGLVSTGTVGANGNNGHNGSMYNTVLHDGEGSPGTNGYSGDDGDGAAGGNGGKGGDGTSGLPYNADAILGLVSAEAGAISDTMGLIADWADFNFARAAVDTVKVTMAWIDVGVAVSDLVAWNVELVRGTVGLGGEGGAGGEGGNGDTFFGGGAGGAGGNGGAGALSHTDGGEGGEGGKGGKGGFGAGGGSGGAGGTAGANGAANDGDPGDGGRAGFGGGEGSNGDNLYGGGGSGYGGAIFVRTGGTLNITGNALFENNGVLAGSSNNGGEAGQAAGTDLFMMRGSSVTLAPGAGNTIRFEGSIADDSAESIEGASWASGNGANIQITGGGLVQFAGENTYSGATRIGGATLEAELGSNIAATSRLVFNGASTIGQGLANANAGVLLTSGSIVNRVGTTLPGQISWSGSGGFAADDDGLTLNFGAITSTNGQNLIWNSGGFVTSGSTLVFGSEYGTGAVTLVNNVNLNGLNGRIAVYDNEEADGDWAVLSGKWTNGTLEVNDTGYAGTLYFTNQNSLTGLTVRNGVVDTALDDATGRLMDATAGGYLNVVGGEVHLRAAEKLTTVSVAEGAELTAHADVQTGNIANAGTLSLAGTATTGNIANSGALAFADTATLGSIANSGELLLNGATTTGAIVNLADGNFYALGNVDASGPVVNAGNFLLGADLTTAGALTNGGTLVVLGNGSGSEETDATRTIATAGLEGDGAILLGSTSLARSRAAGTRANTLILDQSGDSTYAGTFTGAGSLEKTGAGTLTLNGDNTFTGGLTVAGGTIDTTGGGKFADTLAVAVQSGAGLVLGTGDVIGAVTNAGTVTVNAASQMASLTNTGTTDVHGTLGVTGTVANNAGGTLNLHSGSTTSLANLANAAGGTVAIAANATSSFGTLTNSGTVTAASAVNVTGAYVQNAGTLTAGAGLNTGSLSGAGGTIDIGAGTYAVNQTENGTYAGAVTGSGTVVKTGSATLTLAGAAGSFAPSWLAIQQGTVAVNGANILDTALTVSVATEATLALVTGDQTIHNLTGTGSLSLNGNNLYLAMGGNFAGTVTGNGNVQVASGTFNLANTINSSSGNIAVQQNSTLNVASTGSLNAPIVNVGGMLGVQGTVNATTTNVTGTAHLGNGNGTVPGTLASTLTNVNGGGTLSGVGTVTGAVMVGGSSPGHLRPGNSPGVITVADLTLGNLSDTEMEIEGAAGPGLSAAAGGYDQVVVTGRLKLEAGSTLTIANSNDFELALGQKVNIFAVAPGAVLGHFGSVTSAFDDAVAFNLSTGSVVGLGSYSAGGFASAIAKTPNEKAMLDQLRVNSTGGVDQYRGGRLVEVAAAALATGDANAISTAFAQASPEAYAGLVEHQKLSMLDNLTELGGYARLQDGAFYVTGSINFDQGRSQNEAGYVRFKSTDRRFNLGLAAELPIAKVQVSYGRADGTVRSDHLRGDADGDQISIGASVPVAFDGAVRVMARAAYGSYRFSGSRVTNAGAAAFRSVKGTSTILGGGLEYATTSDKLTLNASAEMLYVHNKVRGFAETGVGLLDALAVDGQRDSTAVLRARLKTGYVLQPGWQGFVKLSLDHEFDDAMRDVTANVLAEDLAFTVQNPGLVNTRARIGLGSRVDLNNSIAWTVEGDVGNASSYGARTSITVRF